jgi:hypothetical protein
MWRECAEKHAVFQCCRASVPASTFRASAERLAVFIGSGTSKAIDLRGETPVRAPFSSVRAPDMRFRQLSRDRVPACSLCTNPASAEGMAWFARSDASKSLDSGRKTAVRALIPGGRAQQLRLWRSLFRAHYFGRGRRPPARLPSRPPDRTAGLRTLPYPDGPSPPRLARQTRSAARPNLSWTACQSPAPPHRARPGPAPPSPPGPAAPCCPRARPRPRGRGGARGRARAGPGSARGTARAAVPRAAARAEPPRPAPPRLVSSPRGAAGDLPRPPSSESAPPCRPAPRPRPTSPCSASPRRVASPRPAPPQNGSGLGAGGGGTVKAARAGRLWSAFGPDSESEQRGQLVPLTPGAGGAPRRASTQRTAPPAT